MRILVLHSLPESFVRYDDNIDHEKHDVTYVGAADRVATTPVGVRARRLARSVHGDRAEAVLAAVAGLPRPDLVIALSEFDILAAARVRESLGVPGTSPPEALLVRDKAVMKAAVAAAGLSVPRYARLAPALHDSSLIRWPGRTVLKPLTGASSKDTYTFPAPAETLAAVRNGDVNVAAPDEFEIEEFINGRVIHVDGLVAAGELVVIQASRYAGDCLRYAAGEPLGSAQFETDPALTDWSLRCLKAVGIESGPFHLEAIEAVEGPVFLEVAARCGSVGVVDALQLATGLHQPGAAVRLAVDGAAWLPAARPRGPRERYGWFAFPGHTLGSRSCRISGAEPFRRDRLVRYWEQRQPGEPVSPTISYAYSRVPLAGLIGPSTTEGLDRYLDELFAAVQVAPA